MNANNTKLQSLAKEFKATIKHASAIMDEYVDVAYEQALFEAFDELDDHERVTLIFGMLDEATNNEDNMSILDVLAYIIVKSKFDEIHTSKFEEKLNTLLK
jgi:hypothetical protein